MQAGASIVTKLALALGGLALSAWYLWPSEPAAPEPAVGAAGAQGMQPSAQARPERAFFSEVAISEPEPAGAIALTDQQDLIVDSAMLDIFNHYLLKGAGGGPEALARDLQRRLPDSARREAQQIAAHYQAYIAQHDQLLAAQNFPRGGSDQAPDPYRLEAWLKQRERLRREVLGERVAQAWFQNEDAYLMQAIEELRRAAAEPQSPPSANTGIVPPAAPDLMLHAQHMKQVLADATQSYGAVTAGASAAGR